MSKTIDVLEGQNLFKEAFPEWRYGSVKGMINAAYQFMAPKLHKPFTHRRVETIWQGTARRIDAAEMDVLRLARLQEHRREQQEIRARLAVLDARLSILDAEFHGPTLEAMRSQTRGQGPQAR